jgi:hypothetical protein
VEEDPGVVNAIRTGSGSILSELIVDPGEVNGHIFDLSLPE